MTKKVTLDDIFVRDVEGATVVTVGNEPLPDQVKSILSVWRQANREHRQGMRATIKLVLCPCGDPKYRSLKHVHFIVGPRTEKYKLGPAFTSTWATHLIRKLEREGWINAEQVERALIQLQKLKLPDNFCYPPTPGLEEGVVREHMVDDAVAELCPSDKT